MRPERTARVVVTFGDGSVLRFTSLGGAVMESDVLSTSVEFPKVTDMRIVPEAAADPLPLPPTLTWEGDQA